MGTRKQFLELAPGVRIVDRTVETCRAVAGWVGVVVPPDTEWTGPSVDAVIGGGADRWGSISAGVAAVPTEAEIVVVHSASHPLASVELVRRLITAVDAGADGAVPVHRTADVIKRIAEDGSLTTVGREGLGWAQAPMAWRRSVLDQALADVESATEEGAAVETIGGRVVAIEGELGNLHITDAASLELARRLATPTVPPTWVRD
jgi:2-C-methyl-D-erythritol 4-phosphate cytidylyltransferase